MKWPVQRYDATGPVAGAALLAVGLLAALVLTQALGPLGPLGTGRPGGGSGSTGPVGTPPWALAPAPEPTQQPTRQPTREPRERSRDVDTTQEAAYAPAMPGHPDRLRIPSLGVDAPVLAIRAPGRVLTPPRDPRALGWWAEGAQPGAATGSALFAGHTVHSGGGALDDLETVRRGSAVTVLDDGRRVDYAVTSVQVLGKTEIAARAGELFAQDVPGRLGVLTCEDWDGSGYRSNVVVVAEPVSSS